MSQTVFNSKRGEKEKPLEVVIEDVSSEMSEAEQTRIIRRILEILVKKIDEINIGGAGET